MLQQESTPYLRESVCTSREMQVHVGSTQPADHPHSAAFPATFSTTDFKCISERSTIMVSILEILITASV